MDVQRGKYPAQQQLCADHAQGDAQRTSQPVYMQMRPGERLLQEAQVIDQRGAYQDQDVVIHEMKIAGNREGRPAIEVQKELPRHEGPGRGVT